jgi:hypothetical protein
MSVKPFLKNVPDVVVHTCNPSYSRGRESKIPGHGQSGKSTRPYMKNKLKPKCPGGAAHVLWQLPSKQEALNKSEVLPKKKKNKAEETVFPLPQSFERKGRIYIVSSFSIWSIWTW